MMKAPWNFARFLPLAGRLLARGRLADLVVRGGQQRCQRKATGWANSRMICACCRHSAWRTGVVSIVRSVPKALVSVVAGLMYFLSPVDAIPDFIPVFGMLDDIAVLAWVMKVLDDELSAFRLWRNRQQPEKLAVVERLPDNRSNCNFRDRKKPELIRYLRIQIDTPRDLSRC
jgi:uncharacterized membrane protein YkvA (DUF1232 family)